MIITFSSKFQNVGSIAKLSFFALKNAHPHMLMIHFLRVANESVRMEHAWPKYEGWKQRWKVVEACWQEHAKEGGAGGEDGVPWMREEECLGPWAWQGGRGCRGSHLGQRYYPSRTDQPGTILGLLLARPMGSDCAGASLSHTPDLLDQPLIDLHFPHPTNLLNSFSPVANSLHLPTWVHNITKEFKTLR